MATLFSKLSWFMVLTVLVVVRLRLAVARLRLLAARLRLLAALFLTAGLGTGDRRERVRREEERLEVREEERLEVREEERLEVREERCGLSLPKDRPRSMLGQITNCTSAQIQIGRVQITRVL